MVKLLDNKKSKVIDALRGGLNDGAKLSVVSAYFTIFAFDKLREELAKVESLRFLFTAPTFVQDKEEKREFYISRRDRERSLSGTDFEIKLRNELTQTHIAKECAAWLRDKADFRSMRRADSTQSRLIHADHPDGRDFVIQGSLDFTSSGLGITASKSLDVSMYNEEPEATKEALAWFNEIWTDPDLVEDVKERVLEGIEKIYAENSPEFLYFVTLYNLFSEYLEDLDEDKIIKAGTGIKETNIWQKLYRFQRDGVIGAVDKLERHNGCIIADSVGLGKTFEALAVIKYYELRNDRVLVMCPKKLRDNWSVWRLNDRRNTLADDRFGYDVVNHTDLSRKGGLSGEINLSTLNWGNYDLVVIDESHNFRNNNPSKDHKTRYRRLMEDIIKAGIKTKVLMLSATPINNRMTDLKNQVAFITEADDAALAGEGLPSIANTLKTAQVSFNGWSKLPQTERTLESLLSALNIDYFRLLDLLTIARSRKHIEKYYDLTGIGKFPERLPPVNISSGVDADGEFPSYEAINGDISHLTLAIYAPTSYIRMDKRAEYAARYDMEVSGGKGTLFQKDREQSLIHIMRVNILKRLESSVYSFKLTVERLRDQVTHTLENIDKVEGGDFSQSAYQTIGHDQDESIDGDDPELEDMFAGNKVKIKLTDMDLVKWRQDLEQDRERLESLLASAKAVNADRDEKLGKLKEYISAKIASPINEGNRKVVVFSAFADTANYLYASLGPWVRDELGLHAALVTGSSTNKTTAQDVPKDYSAILTCFSPRSKERHLTYPDVSADIDILFATDCVSEGQNLQDCDCLVNYDIHWNPVRIIQRFGRIDRIGSVNDRVQLVNFWPNLELDAYIRLEARVRGRMVLLSASATGEEDIINIDPNDEAVMNDLEYRKNQLTKLRDEVVDLEEIGGNISITDLTLNDFRMELMDRLKAGGEDLERAPRGMYALVSAETAVTEGFSPGVIFALRQIQAAESVPKEQNALHPYYLLYIQDDGTVRFTPAQAKYILDLYRKLCRGRVEVDRGLVNAFDAETNEAKDMSRYAALLEGAVAHMVGHKQETGLKALFELGKTSVAAESRLRGLEDFELISFLVIR